MTAPIPVLLARLEHELETARLEASDTTALEAIMHAQDIAKQIRESL